VSGSNDKSGRSAAIAAAVILLVTGVVFFILPSVMISLASISPWLSAVLAVILVLAFFLLFWLRARYQRGRE
jgi:protein-S-isoprenylcysteine O-methyltransferase Ste14